MLGYSEEIDNELATLGDEYRAIMDANNEGVFETYVGSLHVEDLIYFLRKADKNPNEKTMNQVEVLIKCFLIRVKMKQIQSEAGFIEKG